MIDQIIEYNKTFVAQKGYEKYITHLNRMTELVAIKARHFVQYYLNKPL